MANFQNKKIFYTLKEYQLNYDILLKQHRDQHEDFDVFTFLESEIQFYKLCYDNSTLEIRDYSELIIPEINEAISVGDNYNFELSNKYKISFSKIINFLKDKKNETFIAEQNKYNADLNSCGSQEVMELLINILYHNLTPFNAINQIKNITTADTYDLFLKEFNSVYLHIICEFMYSFDEDIILKAIEKFQHNLSFVYLSEKEISDAKSYIREFGEYKTIFNNFIFSSVEKENSTKLVHLNDLMIDYCNGIFHDPIKGFENLISLKEVYEHLNKGKVNSVSISNNDNIEKRKETNNIPTPSVSEDKNIKKIPAKFHALAYILELLAEGKKPPEDFEGNFKKDEIMKIGKGRCKDSGQNFYNIVKDNFENVSSKNIKYAVFKNNWKEIVFEITINKKDVELFIENNNL
jgi:hypothetical protein